jgi:hypothetical protein
VFSTKSAYTWHVKPLLIFSAIIVALLAAGCKGNRESQLVGSWKPTQGPTLVLNEDKSYSMGLVGSDVKGKWSLEGNNVLLKPESFGGKTKAEALKQIDDMVKKNPAAAATAPAVKKILDGMTMVVSEDNKKGTMDLDFGMMKQKIEFVKEPAK